MSEAALYLPALGAWCAIAVVTFIYLLFVPAPYGRHARGGFGPAVPARVGWIVMEAPALAAPFVYGALGHARGAGTMAIAALWAGHYVYRDVIFPFLGRPGRPMPLAVVLSGFTFNLANGYFVGRGLFSVAPDRDAAWLADPRFAIGAALFAIGFALHVRADATLRALRRAGGTGYAIPRGGAYEFVSCPNYMGETLEWCGFALAAFTPGAASFALWTAANLVPRAIAHHRWYRTTFAEYPAHRKAIIPHVL